MAVAVVVRVRIVEPREMSADRHGIQYSGGQDSIIRQSQQESTGVNTE